MDDDQAEIAKKLCPTCKQDIPSANYDMHAIHCQRFLTICPQCGESVNKNSLQEHMEENHVEVKCDVCGGRFEKMDLDNHKTSTCPKRSVNCKYCEIAMLACDMGEHEESCGSRTEECENCERRILIKNLEDHIASGCKTPPKENGKKGQDPGGIGKPERLVGGPPATGEYGFPFHPRFQPYPYSDEETVNPYFPSTKTYDLLNNDSSHFARQVPTAIPRKPPPRTGQYPMPQASNPRQSPFNGKSRGPVYREADVSNEMDTGKEKRAEFFKRSIHEARNSSSDSDDTEGQVTFDGDVKVNDTSEPRPFPDLTDETLLPCEFCNEMFPADSLGFHQATCEEVPPTHRPMSPPKLKRLSLDPFPSQAASFAPYQDEASAISPNGFLPLRRNSPDIGEGSAPCEFCSSSYPLVDIAMHQVQCRLNPNLQNVEKPTASPPPERRRPDPDMSRQRSSDLPKPRLTPVKAKQTNSASVSNFTTKSSPNAEARSKRVLAAKFTTNVTSTPVAGKMSPPDNEPNLDDPGNPGATPERKPQRNKRKGKPIPKVAPPRFKTFREVNVLGGESQGSGRSIGSLQPNREVFNGSNRGPFSNGAQISGSGTNNDHAANMKYRSRADNPRTTKTAGVNQGRKIRNSRGHNPMRGQDGRFPRGQSSTRGQNSQRGQNFTRGHNTRGRYNRTRGRSYGSNTITQPARQSNNSRQVSGISTEEEPPDLAVQGQAPSIERQRGPGQRLGSGDSRRGFGRGRPYPPKNNNWD